MPCLMPRGPHVACGRCLDVSPRLALRVDGHRPREPRTPPSTPGPPALRSPTTPRAVGTGPLGLAVPGLGGLAIQSRHRAAGDGARVAPPRLPALLALEVRAEPGRPPEARRRASPPHPTHGARKPHLGPPPHPGRTRPARPRGRRADHRQVHAPALASAVAHVARIPHRARPRARRYRILRGPDPHLPPAVRVRGPSPPPPSTRPLQRHRPSH